MPKLKTIPGGLVIMFDGLDGSGKTTQINLTRASLIEAGWDVHVTRNMGGSPIGEELRQVILSSVPRPGLTDLYLSVAVQEALIEDIQVRRQNGQVILVDRSPMSLVAYSSLTKPADIDLAWRYADEGIAKHHPELIIFYDLPIKVSLSRISSRGKAKNYFENQSDAYRQRLKKRFGETVRHYHATVINADNSIADVQKDTMTAIQSLLVVQTH